MLSHIVELFSNDFNQTYIVYTRGNYNREIIYVKDAHKSDLVGNRILYGKKSVACKKIIIDLLALIEQQLRIMQILVISEFILSNPCECNMYTNK